MKSLGELFVMIKRTVTTINGQEYVEAEYRVKSDDGDYRVRLIMEKQVALKLVENSSAELAHHPQQRLLVKG